MTWVTWRQFRVPGFLAVALLVVLAVLLGVTGHHLHHLYAEYQAQLPTCTANGNCDLAAHKFLSHYHHLFQYLGTLVVAVPGAIGVFWGAPLIARELETGTYRLAWTQSVSRTRWLAIKLGVVGLAAAVAAVVFSLLVTWWAHPIDHLSQNRYSAEIFSTRGVVPLGYAVFAFVLGAALGLVIRRTLPAMAVTIVAYVAVHLAVISWIRPHLVRADHFTRTLRDAGGFGFESTSNGPVHFVVQGVTFPNALVVSSHLVDKSGHVPSSQTLDQFVRTSCPSISSGRPDPTGTDFNHCLATLSANFHLDVHVIPASRYWELQFAETGLYLLFALALAGACFWWIRHRLR